MTKRLCLTALALLLLLAPARAAQLDAPKLVPAPSTPAQDALIRQGVALHDRGDYDGAVRKYEEVLAENPSNVLAIYELGFAYSMKKDYRKSLECGYRGARYKSGHLGGFYLLIGNNLDTLGDPKKALEVYRAGMKLMPQEALFPFNMAVTYARIERPLEMRRSLKAALSLNPAHATSHLMLALHYFQNGYRTPALFAAARFLVIEPQTARAEAARKIVEQVLAGGVTPGKNPNELNITIEADPKKDEGDFSAADLILGLSRAAAHGGGGKGKTEVQLLVEQFETLIAVLSEGRRGGQSSFVYKYYVPYFVELRQKGHAEPFVYHAMQRGGLRGVGRWMEQNSGRVMQFLIWSKNYQWPKDAPR